MIVGPDPFFRSATIPCSANMLCHVVSGLPKRRPLVSRGFGLMSREFRMLVQIHVQMRAHPDKRSRHL